MKNKLVIHVVGMIHSARKHRNNLEKQIKNNNYDAILSEGVGNSANINHYIKAPYLIFLPVYLFILTIFGSEITLINKLAKNKNISIHNIDYSLGELIEKVHKKKYNVVFVLFTILSFIFLPALVSVFLTLALPFGIFVEATRRLRDEKFYSETQKIINEGKYSKILIVCGKQHVKELKNNFEVKDLSLKSLYDYIS